MTSAQGVREFEDLRPHLMAVAYRLTGTVADAEDIVQEAWLRWDSQDPEKVAEIIDLRAWLTTVVSRIGLDKLRSAAHRRETYTGNWLPEPVVTGIGDARQDDPLSAVVAAEDARFAAMVVLERLSSDQRVAFVLHDGFAVPFAEVAEVLGISEPAARQLASRARKAVAASPPPKPDPAHDEVVGRLMAALAAGDVDAVVALLHPDVTFTGDSDGKAPTAVQVIHGRGQGGPVHVWAGATLRPGDVHLVRGGTGQWGTGHLHRGLPGERRVSRDAAADYGDHGARRKGLRPMGYRQPRQVHRVSAAASVIHGTRQASPELKPCSVMPSAVFIRARMFSRPI